MIYEPRQIPENETMQQKNELVLEAMKIRLAEIGPILAKYGVKKVSAFGSVAKGISKDTSDIDIMVVAEKPGERYDATNEATIRAVIQKNIGDILGLEVSGSYEKTRHIHITQVPDEEDRFWQEVEEKITLFDVNDITNDSKYSEREDITELIPKREEVLDGFNTALINSKFADSIDGIFIYGDSISTQNRNFNLDSNITFVVMMEDGKKNNLEVEPGDVVKEIVNNLPKKLKPLIHLNGADRYVVNLSSLENSPLAKNPNLSFAVIATDQDKKTTIENVLNNTPKEEVA